MSEKYTISNPNETGTYHSSVYHYDKQCPRFNQSEPEHITTVPERDIKRYNLRECPTCGEKPHPSLLDEVGVTVE